MSNVAETSRKSLGQISGCERKQQADVILDVVVAACRNGAQDMSLQEIAWAYERQHGKRIDVGTVSGRVTALVTAGRLVRLPSAQRQCSISKRHVAPVTVPLEQVRMF